MLQDEEAKATGRPAPPPPLVEELSRTMGKAFGHYRQRVRRPAIALAPAAFEERSMQEDTFLVGSIMKEIVEPVFRQSNRK